MRFAPITALAILLATPGVAEACAVCFSATESNRGAFIGTTVFLTLLPLLMIGSVAFYVYRRVKELEAGA